MSETFDRHLVVTSGQHEHGPRASAGLGSALASFTSTPHAALQTKAGASDPSEIPLSDDEGLEGGSGGATVAADPAEIRLSDDDGPQPMHSSNVQADPNEILLDD